MTQQTQKTHSFQAEVAQLLHLVTHALYSNQDIFLRELVSNASDACDKLRFEAVKDSSLYGDDPNLEIRVSFDEKAKTVTIADNGIGLSEAEAIENLGTIAKSGTKDFLSKLQGDEKSDSELIGQFGVGFYSAFIVADKVVVDSRRAGLAASEGVRWTSGGSGDFIVETIDKAQRGTSITLHLREDAHEYANGWKLKDIIRRYSEHISLPILMQKQEWKDGEDDKPGEMVTLDEWEKINEGTALWTRSKSDVSEEQYHDFYKQLSSDQTKPLAYTHNKVEGRSEYTQLLYIPGKAPFDLWNREQLDGLKLYVKRVFIMDDAQSLLPTYLRFVRGVVDSADLPLNISRELLQESRDVRTLREANTRRVLGMLEKMANSEPEKFKTFYAEFGAVLKEGLGEDFANQERIAKLLRYASSTTEGDAMTSLAEYKERMKDEQEAIYYITADTVAAAKNSPQLEIFRKKGIEVLLMTDKVDEWAMGYLTRFDDTPMQSVAKGAADLGKLEDEESKKEAEKASEEHKDALEAIKKALEDKAADVRISTRLVDSAACLVSEDGGMSMQLKRMLQQAGQDVPDIKPILEINADNKLIGKLLAADDKTDLAHIVFDQALLAEGGLPDDPAAYVQRVNVLLV